MTNPTPEQLDSVRNRLECIATVGARRLVAGDDDAFIGYAVRVIDLCLAELGPPTAVPSPPLYDWSVDDGG